MNILSSDVDIVVSIVTASTGLVAATVAAAQLSYRHRMMRTATWVQEQLPSAADEQRNHLEDMQLWAQSEVVAATMVPSKVFIEPLITATLSLLPLIMREAPTFSLILNAFLVQSFQYRRTIRLYIERRRCARDYYEGRATRPAYIGILFQMEGGTRREFLWASIVSAGLTATATMLSEYIHHENKVAIMFSIAFCAVIINFIADFRSKHRYPFLAESR